MLITVEKRFLVLPVRQSEPTRKLYVSENGVPVGEWDISLNAAAPDFFAYLDVSALKGRTILLSAVPACAFWVRQTDEMDLPALYKEPRRPLVHFTVKNGWNNDPNGLVQQDGVWHMYCQYNPCSTGWNNMCWQHAESTDLFHWKETGTVLFPDETGMMYSGSGLVDSGRRTGLGGEKAPLLFFYTAAGNGSDWSKGVPYTQRLAWSDDNGHTLHKYPKTIVPHIAGRNRDPKVIFCEELGCYVMALYLEEDRYALLTSSDLIDWDMLQEFSLEGDNECPDFFPLQCENERRWVFIGAHDRYIVGQFENGKFVAGQPVRSLGAGPVYYAAQTYSNAPDGRRVRIGWHRLERLTPRFSQQMGVPCELTLHRRGEEFVLCQQPVEELAALRRDTLHREANVSEKTAWTLPGAAQEIVFSAAQNDVPFALTVRGVTLSWLPEEGVWEADGVRLPPVPGKPFLRLIADTMSLELFAGDGSSCCVCAAKNDGQTMTLSAASPLAVEWTACALQNTHEGETE